MPQAALSITHVVNQSHTLKYLRYLPQGYTKQAGEKWPLILFLHGAGERGDDLEQIKNHGIPKVLETRDLPFVVLSPQCPPDSWWSDYLPALDGLIAESLATLNVDPRRVYLTGLSMGGFGTWHMAVEYPQRFAAIAPICGGGPWMYGVYQRLEAIRHLPTWVFHGAKDDIVAPAESQRMVERLQELGGNVCFTLYPDADHNSWEATYNNPMLFDWFLAHKKAA